MKKFLLLSCWLWAACIQCLCGAEFDPDTKYKISCPFYPGSVLVPGTLHGFNPELYCGPLNDLPEDAWWYVRADANGYTIQNASTKQYITFTTERFEGAVKGLTLTGKVSGDDCRWNIVAQGDYYSLRSVSNPDQWFNLRTDGTYLLGTYPGSGAQNELFSFEADGSSSGGTDTPPSISGLQGKTNVGEYWENTGLVRPVVYTTDAADPVYYSIINLRQSQYVCAPSGVLEQTALSSKRGRFYFMARNGGVVVYTESGQMVSTDCSKDSPTGLYVAVTESQPEGNRWNLDWYSDWFYPGYTIGKIDDLLADDNTQYEKNYWNDYQGTSIGYWDIDAGSTFVFASSDTRHLQHLAKQGIVFEGTGIEEPQAGNFKLAIDSLRLNDKQLVYDALSGQYMMQLPTALRNGGDWTTTLTMKPKAGYEGWMVTIEGARTGATADEIVLTAPNCQDDYTLVLRDTDGNERERATLRFTYMPLVEVTVETCNGITYTTGSIRVTDADLAGYDSTFIAAYRYRGATAQGFEKKAYAIKLRDENGNSVDREFFGLRNDNNWILDAMAVDPACMRNRVATDIWNDFSTPPYYKDREKKARTGTRGRFVEVFLNGKYHGIYCMTEKMDRKQLKLKKYVTAENSTTGKEEIHGLLYKSSQWSYEVLMGHDIDQKFFPGYTPMPFSNTMGIETWAEYEFKYPDFEEEAVDWGPLWNAVNFVATSSASEFRSGLAERFDYDMLKDYYLFIELLLTSDNHGKNMFWYAYDKQGPESEKLGLAPWDLDGSLGARWDGSTDLTYAQQDFEDFLWANEHGQLTLYYNLARYCSNTWPNELKERYCALRATNWQEEALKQIVADYATLFAESGADLRERDRWFLYHSDIASAASYIESWLHDRIAWLDNKYGFDPLTVDVNEAKAEAYLSVSGGKGVMAITAGKARQIGVYTSAGVLVRSLQLQPGQNRIGGLQPGIYVVGGNKVVVK